MNKVFITADDRYLCRECLAKNKQVIVKLHEKNYFDPELGREVDLYKCEECNTFLKLV